MHRRVALVLAVSGWGCGLSLAGSGAPGSDAGIAELPVDGAPGDTNTRSDAGGADAITGETFELSRVDNPANVDLTEEGTLDWVHWGEETAAPFVNRKANVTPLVAHTVVGTPTDTGRGAGYATVFRWNDALPPDPEESGADDLVFFRGAVDLALEISLSATSEVRRAKIYLGLVKSRARLTVGFDDGLPPRVEEVTSTPALGTCFVVDYRHPTPGAKLRVRWTLLEVIDATSAIHVAAVSLRPR